MHRRIQQTTIALAIIVARRYQTDNKGAFLYSTFHALSACVITPHVLSAHKTQRPKDRFPFGGEYVDFT